MTLGSAPLTSRAGSGEATGATEGVPPRPVGEAPSVGDRGRVRTDGPVPPRRRSGRPPRGPGRPSPRPRGPRLPRAAPNQRRPPEPLGPATAHVDAFAPGRLIEALRRPVPVLGDRPDERSEFGVVGRRRGVLARGQISFHGVTSRFNGRRPGRCRHRLGVAGDAVASRSRSVLWARLRIDPTLPGLVRRNDPISA